VAPQPVPRPVPETRFERPQRGDSERREAPQRFAPPAPPPAPVSAPAPASAPPRPAPARAEEHKRGEERGRQSER
jgi:S-DNA-T family DNA segregation ATPase FtsK/SpoIIIE